ncbi:Os10g0476350 [Oryza sativa Japonica Group]|uniref:Os10g0476350 protein n=1 Tax=Oryza sativa subsp. japonica TaxID=39947 RepID=C7J7R2_ORYSJ|nr:Os10g0476350 [Oryza sativa Japonica Group]|eukprot:NP_001176207.1 Os10g0476350 [Oryza sativa Japonica Group]
MGGAAAAAAAAPGFGAALVSRWIGGVRPGSSVEEQSHGGGSGKGVAKLCEAMAMQTWPSSAQRGVGDNVVEQPQKQVVAIVAYTHGVIPMSMWW